jgi:hypothetical protein
MAGISGVSGRFFSPPKKLFNDPADWGGDGPNVLDALANSLTDARKSDKNAWTQITVPEKASPGATTTVPYRAQKALKRTVEEPSSALPGALKGKPFDAGSIGKNAGRIAILGQLGANDMEDTYKITLVNAGKLKLFAPNPDYNSKTPGSKVSLGDAQIEVFDSKGKLIASSDTRNAEAFSNWISLSTENIGATATKEGSFPGLALARGDYTVKVTRENPSALLKVGVNKAGELDFTGSVMNDVAKVDSNIQPVTGEVAVKNSEGVSYLASFIMVKKSDGGAPTVPKQGDPAPDPKEGRKGGEDKWELQLAGLKPAKAGDPTPNPPIDGKNPISLGVFTLGRTDKDGKALPPSFIPSGAKFSFADVKTIPAKDGDPASKEVTPVKGELSFALKDPNALANAVTPAGVAIINPGDIKTSLDGAKNVSKEKKVNYSLFAVMGDPGATTFYTVKSQPQTAEEKKKAEENAAIKTAKDAAKKSNSGAILSLFS